MKDNVWKEFLEQTEGNYTWEEALEKALKNKRVNSDLNKAYTYIIESSKTGRDDVDELFQIEKFKL